jgi:hypothetical protein
MKLLLSLLAVAGLSGCVAYGVPYGSASVEYSTGSPYYGGAYYGSPYVIDQRPVYIHGAPAPGYGHGHPRGGRDRDGDGVPNRYDRDRDGDGVPNRYDSYPNNPRRR